MPERTHMERVNHIHFVGIGGAGMCGIAEVLHNLGFRISGTDLRASAVTRQLEEMGIRISYEHAESNVNGSDVVVHSGAVHDDNPEILAAKSKKIPVVPRAEMLSELMRFRQGIAIAGTHGKTTTTSLVASLLAEGGLDPTYVIGGRLNSIGSNARLGTGRYLVAEADESDGSFLHLTPVYAVITNIDADHLGNYHGDFDNLTYSFREFLYQLPFYGLAVVCLDDPVIEKMLDDIHKPFVTYGLAAGADYRATDMEFHGPDTVFSYTGPQSDESTRATMKLPGRHNVLNALAAVALASELGVETEKIVQGLKKFQGIARRFSVLGEISIDGKSILVIDDYAHHPTEIRAVFDAVRQSWPERKVNVIFQPHRYSRTRDLFEEFCEVLSGIDSLVVTDIYPAGELPIPGIDSKTLCRAIRVRGVTGTLHAPGPEVLRDMIANIIADGEILLVLGAGDIGQLGPDLVNRYPQTTH